MQSLKTSCSFCQRHIFLFFFEDIMLMVLDLFLTRSPDANLFVISITRIAGDSKVVQQVNTVVFIISTQSSFQESFPVIVVPAKDRKE